MLPLRKTSIGFWVLRCPHTAKPDYDFDRACEGMDRTDIATEILIDWNAGSGLRIYPEFNPDLHVAKRDLPYYPNYPLSCGWDFGLSPACVICQLNPLGQLQIFPSLCPEEREFDGIYSFGERVADHLLRTYAAPEGKSLADLDLYHVGDPAGRAMLRHTAGGRTSRDLNSCFQILNRGVTLHMGEDEDGHDIGERLPGWGWIVQPGEVSHFKRQEAVRGRLRTLLRGGMPALIIDPREEFLISAFSGGFHRKQYADGTYDRNPLKNHFSHGMDALAYLCSRLFSHPSRPEEEFAEDIVRPEPFRSQSSAYHRL